MPRVFVYGTLLRGGRYHEVLAGARFEGEALTVAAFELVDLGPYPALVSTGRTHVAGELYQVDEATLQALDRLEAAPELYQRVAIELSDGSRALSYVMAAEKVAQAPRIASGSWREHRRGSDGGAPTRVDTD